ncbi:MAG: PEGA domain-containing protein [Acidobacteria bacterium]|nr:PEGA domain-containing protein [Acidobacteriota bacterium]
MRGPGPGLPRLALALGLALLVPPFAAWTGRPILAQEEEDLTASLKAMRAAFNRARERIENLEFAAAGRELSAIIEPRGAAKASDLSLEEMNLLSAAYDMRARARFNLGNLKGAEADFGSLVRLNPDYAIDRQTLSPKVVDLFDRVRAQIAGILAVRLDPPKARLLVDGDPVEPHEGGRIAVLSGHHVLRADADGFDPFEETIAVVAGVETRKAIRLRPNRRTLQFVTVPAGVAVSMDGAPAVLSAGPPTPETEALAQQGGFDPKNASAPLLIPMVAAGDHKVTFEKNCYQSRALTVKVALDIEQNAPLKFTPVVLQDARSELRLTSTPSGADVFVDGEKMGATPLTLPGQCGGERDLLVIKPDIGSWSERIRLAAGEVNTLAVKLRPTLAYVGTFRLDEWGRAVWSDEDRPLLDELAKGLKTLNVMRAPEVLQALRDSVIKWMITEPDEVRAGTLLPPALLDEAAAGARADLVLAGLTLNGDPDKTWTLALYSVLHGAPDVAGLRTDQPEGARAFVRRLDSAPAGNGPWWGMGLVDTVLDGQADPDGPLVVRVLPGGPAAKAGLRAGDRIRAVGNRKTPGVREVNQAIAAEMARPGGLKPTLVLAVEDAAGPRTVRLAPDEGPVVIPLGDPSLLYNRSLAEFRLRARAAADDGERGAALLNLGIAFMHFRAYDKAESEGFARAGLPAVTGVSQGTVLYYRGLCALRRGNPAAARSAFEQAQAQAGSTLDSGDGPSAASAASRMLKAIE